MTNPYEPPKTIQKPEPLKRDMFDVIQRYQYRGFYAGLGLSIFAALFSAIWNHPIVVNVLGVLGVVGVVLIFLSLGSILPLSIWGFIKGYRENR